jgi:gluconolactonase
VKRIICLLLLGSALISCKTIKPGGNEISVGEHNGTGKTSNLFIPEELKLISADFSFTEGCSADQTGNVFFTDQPNDKIWKYSIDGELTVFLDKSGRSNGTYFDKNGNLLTCADEKGEIWSISPEGKVNVLLNDFKGKQLNGPNDLWLDDTGGIYFTDPYYQRPYWTRIQQDLHSQDVYYLPRGSKSAQLAAGSFNRPNGIVGTPDGKYLYIADIGAGKIFRYTIANEGTLIDKQLLINRGADGMTLDNKGNIYLTGSDGVYIYDKKGQYIATIEVPKGASNVCFSGKEKNTLFITAKNAIYTIPMTVKGVE